MLRSILLLLFVPFLAHATYFPTLGIGTKAPSSKAIVDATSTTLGMLDPRMNTTQRNAITSVPEALRVWDTSLHGEFIFDGTAWRQLATLDTAEQLSNKVLQFPLLATPSSPAANNIKFYSKTGNALYTLDSSGVERIVQTTPQEVHVSYTLNNTMSTPTCANAFTSATIVKYGTAIYDANTNYSTSTGLFTAPVAGKYIVKAQAVTSTGSFTSLGIQKNGTSLLFRSPVGAVSAAISYPHIDAVVSMAANDTLAINVCQASGGTVNSCTTTSPELCWMMIDRISD